MTAAAAVEISMADSLFNEARIELTRGDYERVRALGDRARDALGRALARGRALRKLASAYKAIEADMEESFWSSRFRR